MPCISIPGGIACTGRRRPRRCRCGSGLAADLLCDWKIPGKRGGTCSAAICEACTLKPSDGKDLCPTHAAEWKAMLEARR